MDILEAYILFFLLIGLVLVPVLFIYRIVRAIFSSEIRVQIRKRWWAYGIWFVATLVILSFVLFPAGSDARAPKRAYTHMLEENIRTAILTYQTEYGVLPPGKDNATLTRELESDNPRHIAFLDLKPRDKNAKGEVLDAWGIPLQITMTDPGHPVIRSAAPDKFVNVPDNTYAPYDPASDTNHP